MEKKVIVISLGGSLIVPEKINFNFLKKFRKELRKNYKKYKFVVVCGGGSIARKYISILKHDNKSTKEESLAGIRATRMNALLLMQLFGKEANDTLPLDMKQVKSNLAKNKVVFCGALRFTKNATSDTTAAKLAHFLKCDFINITNVKGLYTDNPFENPKAKFIPYETWKEFEKRALRRKYHAGQHFVLDQDASTIIRKYKIKTYIIGQDTRNITKILQGKKFVGTLIYG
ncbi:MAG: UMP kinase [Candidatus Pacearchaeota archaeon]|nr:UMP kinase [Candidatus Pacearchaeota archaeon]